MDGFSELAVILVFTCVIVGSHGIAVNDKTTRSAYNTLLEDYLNWRLSVAPELASMAGHHQFDGQIRDISLSGAHQAKSQCQAFSDTAEALLLNHSLEGMQNHYLRMVKKECDTVVRGVDLGGHLFAPAAFMEGMHALLPDMFSKPSFFKLDTFDDYVVVLQRLNKVAGAFDAVVEVLKEGVANNLTFAIESVSRVGGQIKHLYVDNAEDSQFFTPFAKLKEKKINGTHANNTLNWAKEMIMNDVLPSIRRFDDYLHSEYMQYLRKGPGVLNLPNGDRFYQACLDIYTMTPGLAATDIHELGLEEVKRLRDGVDEVKESLGYGNLTLKEFFSEVRSLPEQSFYTQMGLLTHIRNLFNEKINPAMKLAIPKELLSQKLFDIDVSPLPPGFNVAAYYVEGNKDGSRNGTFYINTHKLDAFKKFELMSLSLHEGNPGHHFDLTVFRQAYGDNFPRFVGTSGFGMFTSAPAATPEYTSFIEGWALYSEYLGHELGLFKDPFDLLGFYSWNLLRGARLVIDTGLHAFGWSRQKAIDYILENTVLSEDNAILEVDRYITWPGQAVAYKIGEIELRRLRAAKEKKEGSKFDLRQFHKNLLACKGPLSMLEDCISVQEKMSQLNETE